MRKAALIALTICLAAGSALAAPASARPRLGGAAGGGKKLYDMNCSQCHGDQETAGASQPVRAAEARDFTAGKFKIRTTPSGALPTTQDLKHHPRRHALTRHARMAAVQRPAADRARLHRQILRRGLAKPDRQPEPIQIPSRPRAARSRSRRARSSTASSAARAATARSAAPTASPRRRTDDWDTRSGPPTDSPLDVPRRSHAPGTSFAPSRPA